MIVQVPVKLETCDVSLFFIIAYLSTGPVGRYFAAAAALDYHLPLILFPEWQGPYTLKLTQ